MPLQTPQPGFVDSLNPLQVSGDHRFLPGRSLAMRGIQRVVAELAPTDWPILLAGEPGTGKEVLALHIHRLSHRRDQGFNKLSCTAVAVETLQRFLGDSPNGYGSSDLGNGGTLFLDEIADLNLSCQSALSDFFSARDGTSSSEQLGPRVICSTSRNLDDWIRAGHFREELYFRISAVGLRLPPLRHRKEDILAFLDFFLQKSAGHFGRPQSSLSSWALRVLLDYPWPGNVRELEEVVANIVALGDEELALANLHRAGLDLPLRDAAQRGVSLKEAARAASRRAERELMLKVLTRTRWNRKLAAKELQISYKALLYKLKLVGLEDSANS